MLAPCDVEFREHLPQVVLDGSRTDEQAGANLWVREAVAREPCDFGLLRRELVSDRCGAFADRLAGGEHLALGAIGEGVAFIATSIS